MLALLLAFACRVPTTGYDQACEADSDCPSALDCLDSRFGERICTLECDTDADCPNVPSDHDCGMPFCFERRCDLPRCD